MKAIATVDPRKVSSTPEAVALWVAACKAGEKFAVAELIELFTPNDNFSDSALRQQLGVWAKEGRLTKLDGRGQYQVTPNGHKYATGWLKSASVPAPAAPAVEPAAAPEPGLVDEPPPAEPEPESVEPVVLRGLRSNVVVTLTTDWSPPPLPAGSPARITESVRAHVDRVLGQLKDNPGRWMLVARVEGGANPYDRAGKQVKALKEANDYPQVELVHRPIEAEEGTKVAGVWARWVEPRVTKAKK